MNPAVGEFADMNRSFTALGRYAKPEEVASLVAYLATPEAAYISGASLLVDGGYTA
jgi:3-oxoacyl-[acyl-carrier protein] reductase